MLVDPKFPHNVGAAVRAASCYGVGQVWFTGDRVQLIGERRYRLQLRAFNRRHMGLGPSQDCGTL